MTRFFLFVLISVMSVSQAFGAHRIVNLVVGYKTVLFAGKTVKAIAVNDQIPGPTLHFKEGDRVTINVYNHLDHETAIHWHGMIVPWQMDGVLGVTQHGIQSGRFFQYQFKLHQSGTYWYHAHSDLQEQQGLYGAFIIDPLKKPAYRYTKDYVIVLSDWINTHPDQVLANLKKEGDFYSPNFPLQPSLLKFMHDYQKASSSERNALVDDYKMMQQMRMSIYDISDVAYDAFLLNGKPASSPWIAPVKVGDVVRLRFIGAGGSSIFHVKIPNASMQMVHVEGNDVVPYAVKDFKVSPGETYDVLLKITKNSPYIIYAESMDTVGAARGALVTNLHQMANYNSVTPFPEPLPVTREMMSMMMGDQVEPHPMKMEMSQHDMSDMSMMMPTESTLVGDKMLPPSSYETSLDTKYQSIKGAVKTNDPHTPVFKTIHMELFGYMDHYIWFINGIPEHQAKPIILEPNKRYRLIFTNTSMMHHPMHMHGHWFVLREGKGAYDPLLHTIDIPPGATMTADVDTDASGQWLFHCHLLYHMMSGMSRVFQYSTLMEVMKGERKPEDVVRNTSYQNRPIVRVDEVRPIDPMMVMHPMAHHTGWWFSTFLDAGFDPFHDVQRLTFKGLYGSDYHKLELLTEDAEMSKGTAENADMDIFYWHLISQFWAIKGGVNYTYRPANIPYWQPGMGIEGLMPYFIDTDVRGYYHSGSAKLDVELSRDSQITNNFFVRLGIRSILATKSVAQAEIGSGMNQMRYILRPYYRLMPGLNMYAEYEHEQDYGAFRKFQSLEGSAGVQNTVTFGLTLLF